VLLVGALVTTAGAASRAPRTPARVTKIVKGIGAGHWSPKTTRIAPGGTIQWKAMSNSHTVTAYGGNWHFNHSLPLGSTVSHRFTQAGTYLFRCRIHSSLVNGHCEGMCGKIEVET
jgi:plastocyanin